MQRNWKLNNLRKHRKLMGFRQIDVAYLLDLNSTTRICRWEKGLSYPNVINLMKLSIIYRTFPNELYFDLLIELRHELLEKEKTMLMNKSTKTSIGSKPKGRNRKD